MLIILYEEERIRIQKILRAYTQRKEKQHQKQFLKTTSCQIKKKNQKNPVKRGGST